NVLKAERGYRRDSRAIRPRPDILGTPVTRFLRLTPPRPTPAPPDRDLAFALSPAPGIAKERWDVLTVAWQMNEEQRTALTRGAGEGGVELRPADAFKPVLFVANTREARRLDVAGPGLPFPGGPKSVAPMQAGMLALDWDNDLRTDLVL